MSTAADYLGRTVDILIYDGQQPSGDTLVEPVLAQPGQGGKIVTGIMKLAQRFLMELLTERGSLKYQPLRGTTFMIQANTGGLRTTFDAEQAFQSELIDIKRNLRAEDSPKDPPDERLQDAQIQAVTILQGLVIYHILLTSQAGTTRKVIFPLTATPF